VNTQEAKKRIVIIGLDGVPFRLIEDLSSNGTMPETKKLIDKGIFKQMESSIPEISSVAWSSIITGKNPGEHGIFGYTDIPLNTYRLSFPNFNNLKAEPFWRTDSNRKSIILNVPSTFPVKPLNGIHISGFISLDLERSVYPNSLIPTLNEMNYQIDVDASKAHKSTDMFLNDLDKTLKARIAAIRHLWDKEDWDTFMIVFTGTDRLSHFLWNAYEDKNHKYHSDFLSHFSQIDEIIGEIAEKLLKDDMLLLLSDHGFERLDKEVNISFVLEDNSFLKFGSDSRRNIANIDTRSKAFALESSRIYIHQEAKYPRGSVKKEDYQSIIEDLTLIYSNLEFNGDKVIKQILNKEDIYTGPLIDQAPDLVLIANMGFNLKASLKSKELFEDSFFTGKHTQNDAFLLINKYTRQELKSDTLSVSDILGIIRDNY